MIKLSSVSKIYEPDIAALVNIDCEIADSEFVFVVGASGAGKSTLLKLMYSVDKPTKGDITVNNCNISRLGYEEALAYRRNVGFVFQDYRLLDDRNIVENVRLPLEIRGISREEMDKRSLRLLSVLGIGDKAKMYPQQLSGGEKQRAAIARALIAKPSLILADEPTGNLDLAMAREVFDILISARSAGATVVVATHNLSLVEEFGGRTIVLDKGRIVGDFNRVLKREGVGSAQKVINEDLINENLT